MSKLITTGNLSRALKALWTKSKNLFATKTELNSGLSGKAPATHTHDERYFTESEINSKLGDFYNKSTSDGRFAPKSHSHSEYSSVSHNHDGVYQPRESTSFSSQEAYVAVRTPGRKANQYYEFWDGDIGWAGIKAGDIYANNNKVYHPGNKPTPSDIGAAASSHTHDDRYYTESESDSRFAPKSHSHPYNITKEGNEFYINY